MSAQIKKMIRSNKRLVQFFTVRVGGDAIYFILPLLIAQLLQTAEYGVFTLAQMLVLMFMTAFIRSTQTPAVVKMQEELTDSDKAHKTFSFQLFFFVVALLIGSIVLLIGKKPIATFTGIEAHYFWILFLLGGVLLKAFIENVLLAVNKRVLNGLYVFGVGIANVAIVLLMYATVGIQLHWIFLSYALSAVIVTIPFLFLLPWKQLLPFEFDSAVWGELIRWSSWQVFGLLAVYVINWGDNIILRYFTTLEDIAIYNFAYQLFKGFLGFAYILNSFYLPYISKNKQSRKKIEHYLRRVRPALIAAAAAVIVLLYALTGVIFQFFPKYADTAAPTIFQILLIGLFFHTMSILYLPVINGFKLYRFFQFNNIVLVVINLTLDWVFVQRYGVVGPAIATSIVYTVGFIVFAVYMRLKFYRKILPTIE